MSRFPSQRPGGLGIGLDLSWGSPFGWVRDPVRGDGPSDRVRAYLSQNSSMSHFFASWQPRNRNRLEASEYFDAFDAVFGLLPPGCVRALHQTTFNLAGAGRYDRGAVVDFTNVLIERYGLAWVNEDLGIWSLSGCQMPYPLPPYPTDAGLDTSIVNTRFVQERLAAPLLVEFPGFSDDTTLFHGPWHAYDFFREVIEQSDSPATLDTGHLLSYQWMLGKRGEDLFDELDRLPLTAVFEIHLSGCQIVGDRFIDAHHGVLLDEQLQLLELLLARCPNVSAITYEDPRFNEDGSLIQKARSGYERLKQQVANWTPAPSVRVPSAPKRPVQQRLASAEDRLCEVVRQPALATTSVPDTDLGLLQAPALHKVARLLSAGLLNHGHAGCGSLRERFSQSIAAWRSDHPLDTDLAALSAAFSASSALKSHVELAAGGAGLCLEEAFYRFCCEEEIGDLAECEEAFLAAMMRALATSPSPSFVIPDVIESGPKGHLAVSGQGIVHALSGGKIIRGRLPDRPPQPVGSSPASATS